MFIFINTCDLCLTNEGSHSSYNLCIKMAHFRNCAKQCTSIKENYCTHMAELPKQHINAQKKHSLLKDDRMEPPIQTEYLRPGGATTLIFIVDGARTESSSK